MTKDPKGSSWTADAIGKHHHQAFSIRPTSSVEETKF
jgi:hypothetical protein